MVDYGSTKFASYGLMCHLRQELRSMGKYGINLTVVCPSFIRTGMFEGVRVPMLTTWLSPEYAADQVVKAVRRNQWRVLMPSIVGLLALVVALTPIGLYDFMMRITGALNAMKKFRQTRVNPDFSSERSDEDGAGAPPCEPQFNVKDGRPRDSLHIHHKHIRATSAKGNPFTDLQREGHDKVANQ